MHWFKIHSQTTSYKLKKTNINGYQLNLNGNTVWLQGQKARF